MRRFSFLLLTRSLFVTVALLISQLAFCWGVTGHRVIGEIAQQHLSKKAKKELKKLIGKETIAWWSNWSDFIKSDSTWNHAGSWHYVDVAPHLSKEDFIAAVKKLPRKNLYSQILEMTSQLKDQNLSIEQRRIALRFLIHLIGDLHQPLHVGRDEDQGGNKISVYWFDKKTNLHTIWDSGLIDFQQYSYTEYAKLLDIVSPEKIAAWQSGSIEDWLYESNQLSDKVYDSVKPEDKLSYRYNFQFQQILDEQLAKGGIRLAAVLNEIFD